MKSVYTYRHTGEKIMISFEYEDDTDSEEILNSLAEDFLNKITNNKADEYYLDDVQDIKKK